MRSQIRWFGLNFSAWIFLSSSLAGILEIAVKTACDTQAYSGAAEDIES